MERLWTPWRRAFIEATGRDSQQADCFLCAASVQHEDDKSFVLYRGQRVFVLLNLYPYNSGHLMVAPFAHTGDFAGLEAPSAHELMTTTQRCVAILGAVYTPDAFNIGLNLGRAAGAGVPDHLHVHVVPRWNGDTNFMPVAAETKVLPESLDQTYARLAPHFRAA